MFVAWNLRLPYLYSSAAPGREWQRLNFAALGKGKTRGTFGKKAPGLHTSLRNPPGASPVLSSDPKKQQKEHCSINIKNPQQYRVPCLHLPIRAHNNHKKVPPQPQPETSFCPTNLPRNMLFSNAYLIFDKHYAYYKANTYIKSTHRALLGQYI